MWYDMGRVKGGPGVGWLRSQRNDLLLAAALLLLGAALALFVRLTRQAGGVVSVQIGAETVLELPLGEDTRIVLGEGAHTNTLVIRNGKARIVEASCPDRICVGRGAIQYTGESIVCLPHRLVVTVKDGPRPGIDAAAG